MPPTIDYRLQISNEIRHIWAPDGAKMTVPDLDWAAVLNVVTENVGPVSRLVVRDFLVAFTFVEDLTLVYCTQGRRRGEVVLSMPLTADNAQETISKLAAAIDTERARIREAAIALGVPANAYEPSVAPGACQDHADWYDRLAA